MKLFKPQIRTKNHSANPLRGNIGEFNTRAIVRFGSRTSIQEAFSRMPTGRRVVEINTAEACHNSADKRIMKRLFDEANVKSSTWMLLNEAVSNGWEFFPAIIKHYGSCKGQGIYFIEDKPGLDTFVSENRNLDNFIIERYLGFPKEYRLHVTKDGCFYTCRKMLKSEATDRWHRHDSNSVWIIEENPLFERPKNWDNIVSECVKSLNAVGLDFGACDVKVQSEKNRGSSFIPDFAILEINSAPSMGLITLEKYTEELPKIINKKIEENV